MSGSSEYSGATLVVDFGTGAIRAAVVVGDQSWLVPEPASGSSSWPAAAHWDGHQVRTGTLAEQARAADPDGYWSELKSCLTVDAAVSQGGRTFRPVELVSAVLRAVVGEARRGAALPVDRALLTVPAAYQPGGRHRARAIAAAEAAGLAAVELLAEPVAAACHPTIVGGLAAGSEVLVCDLGAGSFDCALVRLGDQPEILGADSVAGAGRSLDARLEQRILNDGQAWLAPLLAQANQQPGEPAAVRLGIALSDLARRVKHELSEAPVAQQVMLPDTPAYRLTRDELATVVSPVVDTLAGCAERLVRRLGRQLADLDAVLLTGGGARMPVVGQRLGAAFGRAPYRPAEPELVVVRGAAQWLAGRGRVAVFPERLAAGTVPLSFPIPGGRATLERWLLEPGERYGSGAALARVRLPAGGLWDLTASAPGSLVRVLVGPAAEVSSHQWLALASP